MSTLALRPDTRRRRLTWLRLVRPLRLALLAVLVLCCTVAGVTAIAFSAAPDTFASTPVPTAVGRPAAPVHTAIKVPTRAASVATTVVRLHSGDTLWGLANRYGTTVAALQRTNRLGNSTLIYAGAALRIPAGATTRTPTRPAALTSTVHHRTVVTHRTTRTSGPVAGSVRQIAAQVFGSQYECAANIIARESGWNVSASNRSSGAYGLAQALPGSKMGNAGPDWRSDPATQLRWMRSYVDSRYGGACAAWAFWRAHSWY